MMWNPLLYAVANPNRLVDLVKYMLESIGIHSNLSLKEPFYDSESDGIILDG